MDELKKIIIIISEFNNPGELWELKQQAEEAGIEVLGRFSDDFDPLSSYLITDSREAADLSRKLSVGFAVYLNEESRRNDFADALYMIDDIGAVGIDRIIKMHQRFLGIPWHILDTKRLSLWEMSMEDIDAVYGVYDDPDVGRYAGTPYSDRDRELNYIKDYIEIQYRFYEYGIWLVKDKATGEVIGRAGLTGRAGYADVELGYVFAKRAWNRGYATEVIEAIIRYAKEELYIERLNAFVMPENTVSIHILEKFGFVKIKNVRLHDAEHIFMQLEL